MKLILTALAALALPGCEATRHYDPVAPAGLYIWHHIEERTEYTYVGGAGFQASTAQMERTICIDHKGKEVSRLLCGQKK
jgi:hypothetical protein